MASFKGSPSLAGIARRTDPGAIAGRQPKTGGAVGMGFPSQPSPQQLQEDAVRAAESAQRGYRAEEAATGLGESSLAAQNIANVVASPTRMSDFGVGVNLRQPAYEQQAQTGLEARFGAEDFARRQAANEADFNRRLATFRSLSGGGGSSAEDGNILADEQAARAAAFARAKDQAGQTARASLDALRSVMGERGILGGGMEGAGIASIIGGAQGELGEQGRMQAMSDVERAGQIADRNYAGGLTRRGQDISRKNSLLGIISSSGRAY